jgi:hypothetical protein
VGKDLKSACNGYVLAKLFLNQSPKEVKVANLYTWVGKDEQADKEDSQKNQEEIL